MELLMKSNMKNNSMSVKGHMMKNCMMDASDVSFLNA